MRVLIFHGYLLRGTGSNVYNANVAQALARLGHEVHLLCQDGEAGSLPWIDAVGRWEGGGFEVEPTGNPGTEGGGTITAYLPDIGGLLPVYVADHYEGFTAKTFPECDDAEIEAYIAANVTAVRAVAERAGGIDAALANHLVMGPVILARSGLPFAAKVHGSALSYTVIPHRERFLPYAREGMEAARAVLVGSRHTGASLWQALDLEGLEGRTRLGPPGVDVAASPGRILMIKRPFEHPGVNLQAAMRMPRETVARRDLRHVSGDHAAQALQGTPSADRKV